MKAWRHAKRAELERLPCWGGLDLASTRDLTAFALLWRDGSKYYLRVQHFVPEETANERKQYRQWIDAGHIIATPGNVVDYDRVRDNILEACERYEVRAVAYDRKFSAYIVPQLMEAGAPMEPFGQGFLSMAPNRFLNVCYWRRPAWARIPYCVGSFWCVLTARDQPDNLKITKNRNKKGDMVDGVVAAVMALGQSETDHDSEETPLEIWTL